MKKKDDALLLRSDVIFSVNRYDCDYEAISLAEHTQSYLIDFVVMDRNQVSILEGPYSLHREQTSKESRLRER